MAGRNVDRDDGLTLSAPEVARHLACSRQWVHQGLETVLRPLRDARGRRRYLREVVESYAAERARLRAEAANLRAAWGPK